MKLELEIGEDGILRTKQDEEGEDQTESMVIKGFAMNTAHAGNGWHFEHDAIAELNGKTAHFVRDHDTSITAVAGTVKFTEAERFDIEVEHQTLDPKTGESAKETRLESAAKPGFEAHLSSDFPAYEDVARSILSQQKAGKVPNVSVFIYASDWAYEESSDRFFLKGPYWVRHLGQVDVGAFSDEVGVGVYETEFTLQGECQLTGTDARFDATPRAPLGVTASVRVANLEELTHKFAIDNADKPELLAKFGARLGLDDTPHDENGEQSNTPTHLHDTEGCLQSQGEPPMKPDTEHPTTAHEEPLEADEGNVPEGATKQTATETPTVKADKAATLDEAALNERIEKRASELVKAEFERRERDAAAKALADRRTSIANAFPGVDVAVLEGMNSIAALDAYEASLSQAKGAALGRENRTHAAKDQPRPMELWESQADIDDWNAWHKAARAAALGEKAAAADRANNVGIYEAQA